MNIRRDRRIDVNDVIDVTGGAEAAGEFWGGVSGMRHTTLGHSAVQVTGLSFGAAGIGNLFSPVEPELATAAVDAAWDAGIRYFDTAPHYGLGLSERRLGEALRDRPRDSFVISTKVGRVLEPFDGGGLD